MTEQMARADLNARGVWQLAPGLWGDKSRGDMIAVSEPHDNAIGVHRALSEAGQLPEIINS